MGVFYSEFIGICEIRNLSFSVKPQVENPFYRLGQLFNCILYNFKLFKLLHS